MVVVWQEWDNSRFVYEHKTRMFFMVFSNNSRHAYVPEFEVMKC